ncbi:MAG: hypothetical protein AAFV98_22735 [Chloroflexota bacterium]
MIHLSQRTESTASMSNLNISDQLMEVIFSAVEESLLQRKTQDDIVPFVLMLTKKGVVLQRFDKASISEALTSARTTINATDENALGYALAYDSQIEIKGDIYDAVMIEAGTRAPAKGWRFIQRYRPSIGTQPLQKIGSLAYFGDAICYFNQ